LDSISIERLEKAGLIIFLVDKTHALVDLKRGCLLFLNQQADRFMLAQ